MQHGNPHQCWGGLLGALGRSPISDRRCAVRVYSSLSYLRQLPAKQLKIDRSFVNDLDYSSDARLAHALGLLVVAEGAETREQRDILLQLRCDELQDYFFSKPMPADALLAWAVGRKPEGAVDFSPSVVDETLSG